VAIPLIETAAHIENVLGRLHAWRGRDRERLLKACKRTLDILRQTDKLSSEEAKALRVRIVQARR